MKTITTILKQPIVLSLLVLIIASIFILSPKLTTGVEIVNVQPGGPAANATPTSLGEAQASIIQRVNDQNINSLNDYYEVVQNLQPNTSVSVQTDRQTYFVTVGGTEQNPSLGLTVASESRTSLRQGIDLAGGTRVILEPETQVNDTVMEVLLTNIEQRVNAFGLSDVSVRSASDLGGNTFIIVEVPGVSASQVQELLRQQGEFEARIGNQTVFRGGDDIPYVCQQSQCSGLTQSQCPRNAEGLYECGHRFSIRISQEAAQRQADITGQLQVVGTALSENITFFLDGEQVQSLTISADLRGQATQQLSITGTGTGTSQQQARENSLDEMRRTQAILETGSLPVELNIVKTDTISPQLGSQFLQSAMVAGLAAILTVVLIVFIRYRDWRISIPMSITMLSEVIILLGFAALIGWNIDMAAIAAIIIAVGSGVDDQIVITDETLGRKRKADGWKRQMKKAFFIIMAAYVTLLVAMLPLWFAGAGLLKGFAFTTSVGITIGVLISRRAFARMLQIILGKYDEDE